MGNLFSVELETSRGKRYRVAPGVRDNGIMPEAEARTWFLVCLDRLKRGAPIEGCSARFTDSLYLVNVDAQGNWVSDAETRRKHWNWKGEPLGVAA